MRSRSGAIGVTTERFPVIDVVYEGMQIPRTMEAAEEWLRAELARAGPLRS